LKKINQKQRNFLENAKKNNSLVGTYLFCGPPKVGKNELAFDFACEVNELRDRKSVESGANPDVIIIEPIVEEKGKKKRKKDISIEQVKQAIKSIGYYAYSAKYKFLIIKEADRMTNTAANSLLKIIEEPTADTIVVLVSDNELKLLPTVRSRCQIVRFALAEKEEIVLQLQTENIEFEKDELLEVAEFSQGKIIKARELLADKEKFLLAKETLELFRDAFKKGVISGLKLSEELSTDKEKLRESLEEVIWYLRNLLKKQIAVNADKKVINKIAHMLERVICLRTEISNSNVNQRLQLENFFVQL
jgi:DNA polymerase III subunit delta'